jgi:hypothetical protein
MFCHDFFVAFNYSSDALSEFKSYFQRRRQVIAFLTDSEFLDEHIAKKRV